MSDKEHQEISVVGRLWSLEALVLLMGLVSFVYGLFTMKGWHIGFGAAAVAAAGAIAYRCRRTRNR